jgi:hypothetical protein
VLGMRCVMSKCEVLEMPSVFLRRGEVANQRGAGVRSASATTQHFLSFIDSISTRIELFYFDSIPRISLPFEPDNIISNHEYASSTTWHILLAWLPRFCNRYSLKLIFLYLSIESKLYRSLLSRFRDNGPQTLKLADRTFKDNTHSCMYQRC